MYILATLKCIFSKTIFDMISKVQKLFFFKPNLTISRGPVFWFFEVDPSTFFASYHRISWQNILMYVLPSLLHKK